MDLKEAGSGVEAGFMWFVIGTNGMVMNVSSVKCKGLLDETSDCQVVRDSAPWSWLDPCGDLLCLDGKLCGAWRLCLPVFL